MHALLVGDARDLLHGLPIRRVIAGNTVPIRHEADSQFETVSVGPLIAAAIRRNHFDESLANPRVPA